MWLIVGDFCKISLLDMKLINDADLAIFGQQSKWFLDTAVLSLLELLGWIEIKKKKHILTQNQI